MRDKPNDSSRLELMKEAIFNIEEFLKGVDSLSAFASNKILCHAIIYNLQCIGENAYKLSRDFVSEHTEIDLESIEGLRHVLVHDYYTVNLERVWNILEKDLPELKAWLEHGLTSAEVSGSTCEGSRCRRLHEEMADLGWP